MNNSVQAIPFFNLLIAFLPVAIVIAILFKWSSAGRNTLYAFSRMLIQLLLIGYFLTFSSKYQVQNVLGVTDWVDTAQMTMTICQKT